MKQMPEAKFTVGQVVRHRLFGYRGLIFDVDPEFDLSPEWYQNMAQSQPPKDQPWYHVMVDGESHVTYVAERNLEGADEDGPIDHPLLPLFFSEGRRGGYNTRATFN